MTKTIRHFCCRLFAVTISFLLLAGCAKAPAPPPSQQAHLPPINLTKTFDRMLPAGGEIRRAGARLSEEEQALYAMIVTELDTLPEELSFSLKDFSVVDRVWTAVLADYPEFFWLSGAGQWGGWEHLSNLWFRPEYNTWIDGIPEQRRRAEAACADLVARAEGMTDYEKALFFHDAIVQSTSFDAETAEDTSPLTVRSASRSAYGCLVNHTAVCSGYARAFQWLAQRSGMECLRVTGTDTADNAGHEWNCIRLDGDYYYVDVTWDDPLPEEGDAETLTHEYFCITTEELLRTHAIDEGQDLPECTATDCDYYRMQDLYFEEYDPELVGTRILELIDAGETEFSFKFASAEECARAEEDLFDNQVFFSYAASLESVSYGQSRNQRILYIIL